MVIQITGQSEDLIMMAKKKQIAANSFKNLKLIKSTSIKGKKDNIFGIIT